MDWSVQVGLGFLPDDKSVLKLCRKSCAFLYGINENEFKKIPKKMKSNQSSNMYVCFYLSIYFQPCMNTYEKYLMINTYIECLIK